MRFLRELARPTGRSGNPFEREGAEITGGELLAMGYGAPTNSGTPVSPTGALRVGAALRGTSIIAGAVAGLPFKAYKHSDRSEVRNSALERTSSLTSFEMWETVVSHLVLWGNAYVYKTRAGAGIITGLVPIHPARVSVEMLDEQALDLPSQKVFVIDGRTPETNYQVMHIPGLSLDGVKGLGPISYTREMFGIAIAAEEAAARLYGSGLMLSGMLTTDQPLDQAQADALKTRWRAKMQGVANAHDVAVLDRGAKFQQLTMPLEDAQFLESRKFQVTEIARLLGLPGWMLNDQEKSTSWGTGMEQQFTTFVQITLKSYLQRIEQRCTRELLPTTQRSEFTLEGLLRGDSKSRAAFYGSGIVNGWLVPNEIRARENLPPVEWGDEPYLPYNQTSDAESEDDDSGDETTPPPSEDDET